MANRDTPAKPPAIRPKKIDWSSALAYWLALPHAERNYSKVARQFKVSPSAVRKHADANGWPAAAIDVDRRAAQAAKAAAAMSAEERAIQTVRLRDNAARLLGRKVERDLERLDAGEDGRLDDHVIARVFHDADRMARLDQGEATGRIEVTEVQRTLAELVIRVGGFVADAHRDAFMAEVRRYELERRQRSEEAIIEAAAA